MLAVTFSNFITTLCDGVRFVRNLKMNVATWITRGKRVLGLQVDDTLLVEEGRDEEEEEGEDGITKDILLHHEIW